MILLSQNKRSGRAACTYKLRLPLTFQWTHFAQSTLGSLQVSSSQILEYWLSHFSWLAWDNINGISTARSGNWQAEQFPDFGSGNPRTKARIRAGFWTDFWE